MGRGAQRGRRETIRAANALPGAGEHSTGMLKTETTSRIHLVVSGRGTSAKPTDPAIRRFRLARLRVDGRSADAARADRAQRA